MADISYVGEFQLGNLISNKVPFVYLYFGENKEGHDHPLLSDAEACEADRVLETVESKVSDLEHPLVLVCEDGIISTDAASTLTVAGYRNVFVVEGGVNGLD